MSDALWRYDERVEKAKGAVVAAARDFMGLSWWQFRRRRVVRGSLRRALRELDGAVCAKQNHLFGVELWDQFGGVPAYALLPDAAPMPRKEEDSVPMKSRWKGRGLPEDGVITRYQSWPVEGLEGDDHE